MSETKSSAKAKPKVRTSVVVDVETTGLPRRIDGVYPDIKKSVECYDVCRMVQIAWVIVQEVGDNSKVVVRKSYIVKPQGYDIPEETVMIHGISTERAKEEGVEIEVVLKEMWLDMEMGGRVVLVAHNLEFDKRIIGSEVWRIYLKEGGDYWLKFYNNIMEGGECVKGEVCTMECGRAFACIPLPSNCKKYKAPKLGELYEALKGKRMREKHDALYDTEKCMECYLDMRKRIRDKKK